MIPGGLGVDSRQFGPWLRAAPFMSSCKTVIKVPSFFTKKMKVNAKPSPPSKQPPVVVIRIGKPLSEVIRIEKESAE